MSDAFLTGDPAREPTMAGRGTVAPTPSAPSQLFSSRLAAVWSRLDDRLMRWSDLLNPILVKETRQTLRSWSFVLTFVLVLVACWVVTIGGVALVGPSIYFAAGGAELFRAYFAVLSVPLLVVVPFSAYRSLAVEREDNTYDMLSITTLQPRQIIGGKLASAVVQVIVFFSAVAPCLAFTYLLRGVDAPTIAWLLVFAFFASFALSLLGLLLAALARRQYGQLVISVGFVALLLVVFGRSQMAAATWVRSGYLLIGDKSFWITQFYLAAIFASSCALAYFAAATTISDSSGRRSTPLRVLMLLQQATFVGWSAYTWIATDFGSAAVLHLMFVACGYWFVMGAMLNGEREEVPRRALRSFPQSILGRALFTWFNPGPASGYLFAVANLTAVLIMSIAAVSFAERWTVAGVAGLATGHLVAYLVIAWSYAVAYLGLGRLVVAGVRRFSEVTMFASVLLHVLLLLAGSGIPTTMQWMSLRLQNELYSYLQVTNPIWTLVYLANYIPATEESVLVIAVPAAALCLFLVNLPGAARELRRVRTSLPVRVVEDEAELNQRSEQVGPWDE